MDNINERLDDLRSKIQNQDFLEGKGLSNEVNIRIFCYDPKDEMAVRHFAEKLVVDQSLSCHLIEYNLYKVFLSICDDKHITDKVAQQEEKRGKEFIMNQMKRVASNTSFVKKMQYAPHKHGDIVLITGVGEVFPFLRVHALLEAMQSSFSDVPVLVMYPGSFDGRYLKLFDMLTPNPYYRAFSII